MTLQEKYQNWEIQKLPPEAQTEALRKFLSHALTSLIFGNRDTVEEVVVVEDMYQQAADALETAELPQEIQLPDGVNRADIETQFKTAVNNVLLRSMSLESINVPEGTDLEKVPDNLLFIQIKTRGLKEFGALQRWNADLGYSDYVSQTAGILVSNEELRLVFLFSKLLELLTIKSAMANQGIQPASMKDAPVDMFRM